MRATLDEMYNKAIIQSTGTNSEEEKKKQTMTVKNANHRKC